MLEFAELSVNESCLGRLVGSRFKQQLSVSPIMRTPDSCRRTVLGKSSSGNGLLISLTAMDYDTAALSTEFAGNDFTLTKTEALEPAWDKLFSELAVETIPPSS